MKKSDLEDLTLDGGMGSILIEQSGKPAGYSLELLNLEQPETVRQIHGEYIAAGANMVYTNTFGANSFKLGENFKSVIKAGVEIALEADGEHFTALSIGPLCKIIDSDISFEDAFEEFKRIILAAEDKTDAIVFETMTDLREMRAALLAAKEVSNLPVLASMSFNEKGVTIFGNTVKCFVTLADNLGAAAIGANCSLGPTEMDFIAVQLIKYAKAPVFLKPNAGIPALKEGKTVYPCGAEEFAGKAAEFFRLGVSFMGGCCGTTPRHIEMLSKVKTSAKVDKSAAERICSMQKSVRVEHLNLVAALKIESGEPDDIEDKIFELLEEPLDALILDFSSYGGGAPEEIISVVTSYTSLPLIFNAGATLLERILIAYNGSAGIMKSDFDSNALAEKYGAIII